MIFYEYYVIIKVKRIDDHFFHVQYLWYICEKQNTFHNKIKYENMPQSIKLFK